jgi:hypothetical protein
MATPVTLGGARAALGRLGGAWSALADLDEAIVYALASLGLAVASPAAPADADLEVLTGGQLPQFLDVALWRVLEAALNNLDPASLRSAGIEMSPAEARTLLMSQTTRIERRVKETYGVGLGTLSIGLLSADFAAKGTDAVLGGGF